VLEGHAGIGVGQQRDQIGLDEQVARQQVAQQLVESVVSNSQRPASMRAGAGATDMAVTGEGLLTA
jgi:hypothetical protein